MAGEIPKNDLDNTNKFEKTTNELFGVRKTCNELINLKELSNLINSEEDINELNDLNILEEKFKNNDKLKEILILYFNELLRSGKIGIKYSYDTISEDKQIKKDDLYIEYLKGETYIKKGDSLIYFTVLKTLEGLGWNSEEAISKISEILKQVYLETDLLKKQIEKVSGINIIENKNKSEISKKIENIL